MKQLYVFTSTFDRHPVVGLAVGSSPMRRSKRPEAYYTLKAPAAYYTLSGAPVPKPRGNVTLAFLAEFGTPDEFWDLVDDLQDFGDADRKLAGEPIDSLIAEDDDDEQHAVPRYNRRRRRVA